VRLRYDGRVDAVLYGREGPLRALRSALDAAVAGRGQLALITGNAGIGKSALASAIAHEAAERATVTWGRAWEFADAPPYFPVWPCLRALGLPTAHDEGQSFQLWEQVLAGLAQLDRPAVWVIEDVHAADLGTLDLLTFLAQPLRALRVLVLVTTRAEDARLTDRKQQRLTRMARDGIALPLEPLADRDVAAIAEDILGRPIGASALGRLADLTAGNPLFVVECARAFRAAGGADGSLEVLPPTIRQVVLDRVELLPETTRRALACGAVLGREFSAATAARLADALPARVIDQLLPALRSGVVRELRPGHFQFTHTLVRDAIEDALPAADRAALHGRAAAALAALGDSADLLIDRARHALASAGTGEPSRVIAIVDRAIDLLQREGAFDRVFELADRVEESRATGALPAATPEERLQFATIARAARRSDASRRACEDVIALARGAADGELFARAVLLLAADIRPGVIDRAQLALLDEARELLGDRSPALACRLLARYATALQPAEDPKVPAAVATRALAAALETGDPEAILDVLDTGIWGIYYAELPDRASWCAQLLDHATRAGDRVRILEAHLWHSFQRVEVGDFAEFERDVATMLVLSDEIGHPRYRWRPLLLASSRAVALGRFADSERYVTEVARLATLADDPALEAALVLHEVTRAKHQRRPEAVADALAALDHATRDTKYRTMFRTVICACCAARVEDVAATRGWLDQLDLATMMPQQAALLAEPYALAGTDEERRRVRAVVVAEAPEEVSAGHVAFFYEGPRDRLLGLLDASLGELESAETRLRRALARATERGHLMWIAQISYELAAVLRRADRDDEARPFADDCVRIATEIGMTELAGTAAVVVATPLTIEREADVWRIARGADVFRVKDSRGMQLLARLVERPGEDIHVLALASDEAGAAPESSAGEQLDERALKAYRKRLAELEEALAAAEAAGNSSRATVAEREIAMLRTELSRAVGIGGRARQAGSATERARINVQRRLKDAIARIAEVEPRFGKLLEAAVRTGTYCCYRP